MNQITDLQETETRRLCRVAYREEGNTDNPYKRGTTESIVWDSEATRIYLETLESL